jgi:hypothetical protein
VYQNLDDSSGATPSNLEARQAPFTYMGKPLTLAKPSVHKKQISLLTLGKPHMKLLVQKTNASQSDMVFQSRAYSTIDPESTLFSEKKDPKNADFCYRTLD